MTRVPLTSHCTYLSGSAQANGHAASVDDGKDLVMLDIDNTLYSKTTRISNVMQELIQRFFEKLGLSEEEANELHSRYYKQYGLSIRGLIYHHSIDPLDYDRECDGAIPLEDILKPDPALRTLLQSIDTSRYRLWALTNAYRNHAIRVLRLLGIDDLFEAVISCDYAHPAFRCKPEAEYYAEALLHTGVDDVKRIYFVDDSALNVVGARSAGWQNSILFDEDGTEIKKPVAKDLPSDSVIHRIDELPRIWPHVFRSRTDAT